VTKSKSVLGLSAALGMAFFATGAFAQSGAAHPCEQIEQSCSAAGFIYKDCKQGKGLWCDCINPIMQGQTPNNSVLPLPAVDPNLVAACKTKRPKFGEGKVGH
jgi:hypothetical protein